MWCRGVIYVNRFLWGVEGVRLVGNELDETLVGGVLDRDGSFIVVACVEGSNEGSGDSVGGVG